MSEANRCPKCGGDRPAGTVEGLCPRCLLGQAIDLGPPSSAQRDPIGRLRPSRAPWSPPGTGGRSDAGAHPSVLSTLADSLGPVPRVLLRDTEAGGLTPLIHPSSAEVPADEPGHQRYHFLGEIARGGMGAVLKGRDTDLGRDLAVKVLLEKHRDNPGLVRRFIEEAQIGGQLQHPGIVPVYELACFEDRRPFFTMKLVRGHTLAALLDARRDPADERPRFLAIFESACQTMAYAHARGVIHRDLKPHNIMVGSFGEVQVMDWGLAKVLRTASVIDERTPEGDRETIVATSRSGSETQASRAGAVLGTPGYMPPEQATGEAEAVDERADVFAMGAILCEILTGHPPYAGRTPAAVHQMAVAGDVSGALDRLASCGAEAELIDLARRCLAPRAADRPRDAGELARAMTAYLAGVQDRLRAAELARAGAQARADEERKRRKTQLRMAAAILLVLAAGIAGVASQWRRAEANVRKAEARYDLAREAIERFYTGASEDLLLKEPQFKALRDKLLGSALEFYKKLQASLEAESGDTPRAGLAQAYQRVGEITADIGSYTAAIEALERARAIRQELAERPPRSAEAREALAAVLEKQGVFLGEVGRGPEALEVMQQARAMRQRLVDERPGVVGLRFALARTDARLGYVLGYRLNRLREGLEAAERAGAIYRGAIGEAAGDPDALRGWGEADGTRGLLLRHLGRAPEALEPYAGAVSAYEALLRLDPHDSASRDKLGRVLMNRSGVEGNLNRLEDAGRSIRRALATYEELARDHPNVSQYASDLGRAHHTLAWWFDRSHRPAEALGEYQLAVGIFDRLVRDHPDVTFYGAMQELSLSNSGDMLRALGRLDEAIEALRRARAVMDRVTRSDPNVPQYQSQSAGLAIFTGAVLNQMGRRVEARQAYEQAVSLYEGLAHKKEMDLYNIACARARLAAFISAGPDGSSPPRRQEAGRHLDRAMDDLHAAVAAGYRARAVFASDPDLDPLRARPDFRLLMMDLDFPAEPFDRSR